MAEALLRHDEELRRSLGGCGLLCGVDEAGRGPMAGPVVAAAVILPPACRLEALDDSKRLSARARGLLEPLVKQQALAWGLGWVEAPDIDRLGILQATFLAMRRAVEELAETPGFLLVDGRDYPFAPLPGRSLVKGDGTSACVAAASILAKEARDRRMRLEDRRHPGYGFATNMGYGTVAHLEAIRRLGRCPLHRRSFRLPEEKGQKGLPLA